MKNTSKELKIIRILLIILTIIIAYQVFKPKEELPVFVNGNSNVNGELYTHFSYSNIIDLGNGKFGVLSSDSNDSEKIVKIYYYNEKTKKIEFQGETSLDELE
ncbi:hypothetical protein ACQKCU_03440 [Heyndrickxia sporothermodurans]